MVALAASCSPSDGWAEQERNLIDSAWEGGEGGVMRVLTIADTTDLAILRSRCSDFSAGQITSETYARLARLMVNTVTSPEQDGVGIAGPQVGILRRVVAVQRFDKEGEPFEVYPNISITATRGEKAEGGEGCLSVPGCRGMVPRWQDIDISYDGPGGETVTERVQGFTAVIFQHECDHLDGVIYTDRATEITEE